MAKASRKAGSVIAVICGCLGAGWLFYYGLEEFVNWIFGYSIGDGIFKYFFGTEMICLSLLMLATSFFVTVIKDLSLIKKGVLVFSTVVSAVTLLCYCLYMFYSWPLSLKHTTFWEIAATIVLLVGYILFFIYHLGSKNVKNAAWVTALVATVGLFIVYCIRISNNSLNANQFVFYLFKCLSHIAVFYCGLKRY